VPSASRGVVRRGRQIEIDDEREPARLGRARDCGDEFRKAVVDQNSIGLRDQSGGIARQGAVEPMAAPRRNGFFAAGVEQNERDRRAGASHALDAAAIDAFGRKVGDDAGTDRVILAAERARRHFGAGRRKALDPHHDVLHRDAGAQNLGRLIDIAHGPIGPRSPPRMRRSSEADARLRPLVLGYPLARV